MNDKKMDDLISGLTKRTAHIFDEGDATQNNMGNSNNIGNTDNTSNIINTGNTKNPKCSSSARPSDDDNKEQRFCTIVEVETLQKIRIIANREGLQIKEVVGAAFSKAISCYESKHGAIKGDSRSRADSLF